MPKASVNVHTFPKMFVKFFQGLENQESIKFKKYIIQIFKTIDLFKSLLTLLDAGYNSSKSPRLIGLSLS